MKKGSSYQEALVNAGFIMSNVKIADFVFSDIDIPARVSNLENLLSSGMKLFIYPHSAVAPTIWDYEIYKPCKYTTAVFVQGHGHEEVMRAYGYNGNVHVAGWSYSAIDDFKPSMKVENILFAPYHPNLNS